MSQESQTPTPDLRVHFVSANGTDYSYSHYMRRAGYDAWFFTDNRTHPWIAIANYHPILTEEDAARIRYDDLLTTSPLSLDVQSRDILRRLSNCDVLQCNGLHALWAVLSGKPFLYKPFGGDVNHWPFLDNTEEERIRAWYIRAILREATLLLGLLHQKKFRGTLETLGIPLDRVRGWCFPMNAHAYAPLPPERWNWLRKSADDQDRFVILNCSQLMIQPLRHLQYTKGTDIMLRGVKAFVEAVGSDRVALWLVDRGPQREQAREMIEGLGLTPIVRWFPPQSRDNLIQLYNAADVVFDQIDPNIANHGYICIEAMSCGKPVLGYIDHEHRRAVAKEPPIPNVNVLTETDVLNALLRLYHKPDDRLAAGEAGRRFILEHHHWEKASHAHAAICRDAISLHAARRRGAPC